MDVEGFFRQVVKMKHPFGFVLFTCFGWSLYHAADTKTYAEGGNANGQLCVFPFIYNSKWYLDCIRDGTSEGLLWCATTANYDTDKKWGYCPQQLTYAVGGNANGQPCVFPFKYNFKGYWGCTGDGTSDGRLWCSTTEDYNKDKKWGYCTRNLIYAEDGTANGQLCVFPFNYKSKWYSDCTSDGTSDGRLWCSTTGDYNKDNKWRYCPQKLIYAEGGNANGQLCVFPFNYNSKWYSDCTSDGISNGRLWCATTGDYNKDEKWGYCPQKWTQGSGTTANAGDNQEEKNAKRCFKNVG
ncbi:epididymal sperm-binding protein 1 isoform X2 [Rana temporaria]|uniref:epididymal sperm-binding protein 1 isoform X2 n=1 Tax=Rana temporaria TaxID=8407 RepID=UPI001AAE142D|nr:epididymal sperm-binding protein 1 isoform X2 [Rana temporaria]